MMKLSLSVRVLAASPDFLSEIFPTLVLMLSYQVLMTAVSNPMSLAFSSHKRFFIGVLRYWVRDLL